MALITAAQVKSFAGITATTWDTELAALVLRAQALAEEYCDRKLEAADYSYLAGASYDLDRAILDGDGDTRIIVPEWPLNSVTTLRVNEYAISESTSVYEAGWFIESKQRGWIGLRGYVATEGSRNIQLAYNAGYASGSVPDILEQALIEQVAHWLNQGPKEHLLGISGRTLPDGSIAMYEQQALLPSVKMVLGQYARKVFA